jgi:hypothetical protein
MKRMKILFFLFALLITRDVAAQNFLPPSVDIPIQNIPQETQVWCWAAVAQQIILAAKGPMQTPSQCALVAMAYGAPPGACCSFPNPACVKTGTIQQIQWLIAKFGGHYSNYAPPTDPMTLYHTLKAGHPVILQIQSGPQNAHVIVVRGMSFVPTQFGVQAVLHVNDPMAIFTQPVPLAQISKIWISAIVIK